MNALEEVLQVITERLLLVTFQTSFYGNFDFLGN